MNFKPILLAGALALASPTAWAACSNNVPIKSLSNAFPAYSIMTDAMKSCGSFVPELDKDHRLKLQDAFTANPPLYHIAGVANATAVPLFGGKLVRPLDDLIAKYGKGLDKNQFIRVNGKVMAIAALVNTQHLMYREDILKDLGIAVPTTWDEVFTAAEKIKKAGGADVVRKTLGCDCRPGLDQPAVHDLDAKQFLPQHSQGPGRGGAGGWLQPFPGLPTGYHAGHMAGCHYGGTVQLFAGIQRFSRHLAAA